MLPFHSYPVVTVGFGSPGVTVPEPQGSFGMCVVKNRNTTLPVTVSIEDIPGTALDILGMLYATIYSSGEQPWSYSVVQLWRPLFFLFCLFLTAFNLEVL